MGAGYNRSPRFPGLSFPSSYRDSTFLSIFAVPSNAVFWITSNVTFTPIRFMYSLKLTYTAPRSPITTGTTMTFRMRQTFAISSFKSWYFSYFSSSLSFTLSSPSMGTSIMTTSLSCLNFPITLDCEIPQYLQVFTFHQSLRLLFIPAISSFQSTFPLKLPVDIPRHVIIPSFIFLSAPAYRTHSPHGPPFLPSAHSAQSCLQLQCPPV